MHGRFDQEAQDGELQHRLTSFAWLVTTVRRLASSYRFDIFATTAPGVGALLVTPKCGKRGRRIRLYVGKSNRFGFHHRRRRLSHHRNWTRHTPTTTKLRASWR